MSTKIRGKDSVKGLRRLVIQMVVIFIAFIGANAYLTIRMAQLSDQVFEGQNTLYKWQQEGRVNGVEDLEIKVNEAKESYNTLNKYAGLILVFVSIGASIHLIIVTYWVVKRIRSNADELEASLDLAEKASEAKTMFLANMSHEIRTPLNAIVGFSEVLKNSLKGKEREYSEVIHRSANTLLAIINDILDLSKIESGNIILELRPFDLHDLFQQIVDMYNFRASEKGLRLVYVIDKRVPKMIIGDSLRLQQVVSNLLSNAVKFTPHGGTITLSVVNVKNYDEKAFLEISVKDSGIGIPKEAQERIFKPFSQADGGVSRNFGGTGLGLTISQKILQAMQSKLELESFPRQGSTFSFKALYDKDMRQNDGTKEDDTIAIALYPQREAIMDVHEPLVKILENYGRVDKLAHIKGDENYQLIGLFGHENVMDDFHTIRLYYPKAPMIYIGEKTYLTRTDMTRFDSFCKYPLQEKNLQKTIDELLARSTQDQGTVEKFEGYVLVAEDNITNRLLVQILLDKMGLKADYAKDGYEAVAMVKRHTYDLIFMDIHMPQKDGVTATKEILMLEKDLGRFHAPIVALTANALKGDREKYIEVGMDDYMSKPITESQLADILHKFLKKQAGQEEQKKQTIRHQINVDHVVSYNPNRAAKLAGIDRLTMDMLLENYFLNFEEDFGKLRDACHRKDDEGIVSAAHYLKGAAMNLYFESGAAMFETIESMAREGIDGVIDLSKVYQYFEDIRKQLQIK